MRKTLKTLGIVAIAALAFSGVVTATASAQTMGHITGPASFTLEGEEDPAGPNRLTAFGQPPMECPESVYTGHKAGVTNPKVNMTSGDTAITITPHILGCVSGGNPRTVDTNGCDYTFDDFTTTGGAGTYGFTTDIVCNGTAGMLFTGGACTLVIPPQTGLTGLHATNVAGGLIRIHGTLTGITMSACGGLLHTAAAELHQNILMTDTGEAGVSISD